MVDQAEITENKQVDEIGGKETDHTIGVERELFSQEDVNRMIKSRAERELARALKSVGLENLDEVKDLVQAKRDADEKAKSELQKAQELASQKEAQVQNLIESQKSLLAQNDVTIKATSLGIIDPDAAYKLIDKKSLEFNDDGKPTNTEELLKSLIKEKPYLVGKGTSAMNPGRQRLNEEDTIVSTARKWAGLS